jgi:hypothetical protein
MQQQGKIINMKLLKMLGASTASYLVCVLIPMIAGLIGDRDGDLTETPGIISTDVKIMLANYCVTTAQVKCFLLTSHLGLESS